MLNEKIAIPISIILLAGLYSVFSLNSFPKYLGIFALVVLVNLAAKKIAGYYTEIDVKAELWEFRRYWFAERHKLSKPFPLGIVLPLFLFIFSYGTLKWLAVTQTEFKEKPTKQIRKRKGWSWSYPYLRDLDVAAICFAGIISNIALALIAFSFSKSIANISILYAFFNLLPLGKLDGTKLFFSSRGIYFITVLALAGAAVIIGLLQLSF